MSAATIDEGLADGTLLKLPCSWGLGAGGDFGTLMFSGHLDSRALASRLKASGEFVPARGFRQIDGVGFREGGYLPGGRWRPVDEAREAGRGDLPATSYPGCFVALVELSPAAVGRLSAMERGSEEEDHKAVVERLIEDELPRRISFGSSEILGFYRNAPGLASVTFDPGLGKRIGLHLDSWEGSSLWQRRYQRSRILVNLGSSARHLLFMTTPVDVLFEHLGVAEKPGYLVDQCFAETEGNERTVFSLEVRPGEAYIAPTECLVHDGSTVGARSIDICFTVRSNFVLAI